MAPSGRDGVGPSKHAHWLPTPPIPLNSPIPRALKPERRRFFRSSPYTKLAAYTKLATPTPSPPSSQRTHRVHPAPNVPTASTYLATYARRTPSSRRTHGVHSTQLAAVHAESTQLAAHRHCNTIRNENVRRDLPNVYLYLCVSSGQWKNFEGPLSYGPSTPEAPIAPWPLEAFPLADRPADPSGLPNSPDLKPQRTHLFFASKN